MHRSRVAVVTHVATRVPRFGRRWCGAKLAARSQLAFGTVPVSLRQCHSAFGSATQPRQCHPASAVPLTLRQCHSTFGSATHASAVPLTLRQCHSTFGSATQPSAVPDTRRHSTEHPTASRETVACTAEPVPRGVPTHRRRPVHLLANGAATVSSARRRAWRRLDPALAGPVVCHGQNGTLSASLRLKPAPPPAGLRYQNWKYFVWPALMPPGALGMFRL